jgi:hypothetical protein
MEDDKIEERDRLGWVGGRIQWHESFSGVEIEKVAWCLTASSGSLIGCLQA